jgi:hypothetical protein
MMTVRERTRRSRVAMTTTTDSAKAGMLLILPLSFWPVAPRLKCERAEFLESVRQVKFCKVQLVSGHKRAEAHRSAMLGLSVRSARWYGFFKAGIVQNGRQLWAAAVAKALREPS